MHVPIDDGHARQAAPSQQVLGPYGDMVEQAVAGGAIGLGVVSRGPDRTEGLPHPSAHDGLAGRQHGPAAQPGGVEALRGYSRLSRTQKAHALSAGQLDQGDISGVVDGFQDCDRCGFDAQRLHPRQQTGVGQGVMDGLQTLGTLGMPPGRLVTKHERIVSPADRHTPASLGRRTGPHRSPALRASQAGVAGARRLLVTPRPAKPLDHSGPNDDRPDAHLRRTPQSRPAMTSLTPR